MDCWNFQKKQQQIYNINIKFENVGKIISTKKEFMITNLMNNITNDIVDNKIANNTNKLIEIRKKQIKRDKILKINIEFYNIKHLLTKKYKLINTKLIYKKYKDKFLVDVFNRDSSYIQWLISHNWELDTNKEYNGYGYTSKTIKKIKKIESDTTKICV